MGTMPILPQDLIEEILIRVPASNLKRLRSTCKQWYALFNDRRFTKKHFLKAKQQFLMIKLADDSTVNSINLDLQGTCPTIKPSGILGFDDITDIPFNVEVNSIFHCHGLLLCLTRDLRLFIWNPCLEQVRWIKPRDDFGLLFRYSLGYDKKKDMHKILIFPAVSRSCFPEYDEYETEIFDLNSNSWRILDNDDNLGFPDCPTFYNGVSLEGNAYWLVKESGMEEKGFKILSFDFTTEKFRSLCSPPLLEGKRMGMGLASVRDERLIVLMKQGDELGMEFWMSSKIDEEALCWSKLFKVNFNETSSCFVTSFLVDEEKKLAVFTYHSVKERVVRIYGCGDGLQTVKIKKCYTKPWHEQPILLSYAPSLVQIP